MHQAYLLAQLLAPVSDGVKELLTADLHAELCRAWPVEPGLLGYWVETCPKRDEHGHPLVGV